MERWKSMALTVAVAILVAPAAGASAAKSGWITLDVPDPTGYSRLTSVSASASDDVWSVAGQLVLHNNGSAWEVVAGPADANLSVVSATSNRVWVAGSTTSGDPLVAYRTATGWKSVFTDALGDSFRITALLAIGNDVFVAGSHGQAPNEVAAMGRWTGKSWTVDTLKTSGDCVIVGSIAPLKKDAGLLFAGLTGVCGRGTQAPLSFEWRGKTLLSMPSPKVDGQFNGAVAVGPDNYWAVGAKTTDHWATNHPLLAHWTGTNWQLVNAPSVPGSANLNGIAVDATGTMLAVGRRQPTCANCYAPGRTLAIQGKNGAWQKIGTPNPFVTSTSEDAFVAVTAIPDKTKFWAVGTAGQGTPQAWAARYSH